MSSYFIERSRAAILVAVAGLPEDAPRATVAEAIDAAYPFRQATGWPFIAWATARKAYLGRRYPPPPEKLPLFDAPRRPRGRRC